MPRVRIIEEYCKGCQLCVDACKRGTLQLSRRVNARGLRVVAVVNDRCTGCRSCVLMCPDAAIELLEDDADTVSVARAEQDA